MEYQKLFKTLNQYKVNYLICGGMAVNIYGIPRMTADIDIILDFEENNLSNFENALKLLLYQNSIPVSIRNFLNKDERKKAVSEKNLIAYSYYNSISGFVTLDVLLDTPIEFSELWKNRSERDLGNLVVNIIGIEDLISLKKYANRIQDQNDVLLLSKLIK
ncbi:MAG: hypothetical protein JNJ40_14975 [Bacteroidia bacterium]|nr:hypothetical protein [Bacteroidia bacterium]